jgi:hypothetical protein
MAAKHRLSDAELGGLVANAILAKQSAYCMPFSLLSSPSFPLTFQLNFPLPIFPRIARPAFSKLYLLFLILLSFFYLLEVHFNFYLLFYSGVKLVFILLFPFLRQRKAYSCLLFSYLSLL